MSKWLQFEIIFTKKIYLSSKLVFSKRASLKKTLISREQKTVLIWKIVYFTITFSRAISICLSEFFYSNTKTLHKKWSFTLQISSDPNTEMSNRK